MEYLTLMLLALAVVLLILLLLRPKGTDPQLLQLIRQQADSLAKLEQNFRDDFRFNREEAERTATRNREELGKRLDEFTRQSADQVKNLTQTLELRILNLTETSKAEAMSNREELGKRLDEFTRQSAEQVKNLTQTLDLRILNLTEASQSNSRSLIDSLGNRFLEFQQTFDSNVKAFNDLQREKFSDLARMQEGLVQTTEKKLEEMRQTVDEKLQKTLGERLGQSFKTVGEQLEAVQRGLGEMQTLAQDVGGLKKVLSNVKQRGGLGEIQLEMLLEQIMAPEQYEADVATRKGSADRVEFAIKLPNRDNERTCTWLPIDAKFPKDAYERVVEAYEAADPKAIDEASKILEATILNMAKDISSKYIDPPNTTDFAILFLPFEGIYAEVIRRSHLLEKLQREYKVMVTGPTTLAVVLNSLQVGFRILTIEKRSSEVWKILGEVKNEFVKFGDLLKKAKKNIELADGNIADLMGKRSRAIERKLRSVESLPSGEDVPLSLSDVDDLEA